MRLSLRLTLLLVTLTLVVALVVGWFAVHTSTQSQYAALDAEINSVISSGAGSPIDALANALNVVQANNYDLTLVVVGSDGGITKLNSSSTPLPREPSLVDARRSLRTVRTSQDLPGFRYRSENAGGGSLLVVAASTRSITDAAHSLEEHVALVGLLAALLSIAIAVAFTSRDIRLIRRLIAFAGRIARDEEPGEAPPETGSPELRELRTSLVSMVGSLHRALDNERRASREMQRFIGDASHELRTPLTVIRGYSEMLERPDIDDDLRVRALERVRREVLRMDSLVADLLFLAEVREAGDVRLEPVPLDVIVADAVRNFRIDHPARTVRADLAPDVWVRGRPEYVERLMNNALTNIARHTPVDAAVEVTLRHEGDRVHLGVDDAGPGLPDEAYRLDVRQFRRFDPARSRDSGGTGLGMSIMADVVTHMGGEMRLTPSRLGGLGLVFAFTPSVAPLEETRD